MKIVRAFKYRLYPSIQQQELIKNTFGCCRFIYNKMLSDKIDHYKETGQLLNNTPAQYKNEFEWLKDVDAYALCNEQLNLKKAFNRFSRNKNIGFPKFKSKKHDRDSYTTNNVHNLITVENNRIKLPKLGWCRFANSRQIPTNYSIKCVTISQSSS